MKNLTITFSESERPYYYHSNHLGSSAWITNYLGTPVQSITYLPYGKVFVNQQSTSYDAVYKFIGKERDSETGYDLLDNRYYSSDLGMFISTDPLAHLRSWMTPYNYSQNSPINRSDPSGLLDDVYITGKDAENATNALNKSSSLNITRDNQTGKLSATGKAETKADKMLLKAINSKNIDVNLITTDNTTYNSKDGENNIPLVPAGFEGSEVINGKVVATQYLNYSAAQNIANIVGESVGNTITHEINEAYIGGRDFPGGDYNRAYNSSHNKAAQLDNTNIPIEFNKNTKSEPLNIIMQGRIRGSNNAWSDILKIPKK